MTNENWLATLALLEKNPILKKHVATVHVEANLSELEINIFNMLLYNAYPKLGERSSHTMKYTALCELIEYNSGDRQRIKDAIRNIARTQIEWIGTNERGKEISWKIFNYLSSAEISWGSDSFTYGFDPELAQYLYQPEVFAKINLIAQRKFGSKYTISLYENCARYRKTDKFEGKTPLWDVELFRKLMGVSGVKLYSTFAELNRRIIKPSIKEINQHSDIAISIETKREGRKVVGVQFLVSENKNQVQLKIPWVQEEVEIAKASENQAVIRCIELGIWDGVAIQWLKAYGEAYLLEKIQLAEHHKKMGKIHTSLSGWLVRAVKDDFKNEEVSMLEEKQHKREMKRQNQEAEWAESEQKIQKQREKREEARRAVKSHLASLSPEALFQLESEFIAETPYQPSEIEFFHDWLAEKESLGNPYPAKRVMRVGQILNLDK